ncbi:MAG: RHS repeat protein, partial [Anaerolineae bacterium]|nr:RHS repeat protein [Anaerolineae bacterium]
MRRWSLSFQSVLNVIVIAAMLASTLTFDKVAHARVGEQEGTRPGVASEFSPETSISEPPQDQPFIGPRLPSEIGEGLIFEDDFESGLNGWRVFAGEAEIEIDDSQPAGYGRYVLSLRGGEAALVVRRNTAHLENYVVTALVKQVGEEDLDGVVLVRAEEGPGARVASYKLEHDTDTGFHLDKRDNVRMLSNRGDFPERGVWEWQKVYVAGDVIKARHWPAGEEEPGIWHLEVQDGERSAGSVGLAVYSAWAHVAYVRVEAVEGTPDGIGSYSEVNGATNDSGWGPTWRLSNPDGRSRRLPAVVADDSGHAYAVWQAPGNGVADIYFAEGDGDEWSDEVRINDQEAWSTHPAIAADRAGNVYVAWEDEREGSADVYFTWRAAGSKEWSANERVHSAGEGYQGQPTMTADGAGNVYLAWKEERKNQSAIYVAWRPAGTRVWHVPEQVVAAEGVSALERPVVAADAAGNVYLAWEDRQGTDGDIYFAWREADAEAWSTAERVNDDGQGAYQGQPDLAADPAGNVYLIWEDGRENGEAYPSIYFAWRPAGTEKWSANEWVNDDVGQAAHLQPAIAAGPGGLVQAVWEDYRSGHWHAPDVYSSNWSLDGQIWSLNKRVNGDRGIVYQGAPAVAVDGTGTTYTLWQDNMHTLYYTVMCMASEECPLSSCQQFHNYVAGPVDTFSGNYHYRRTLFNIPTSGPPLRFEVSYNSGDSVMLYWDSGRLPAKWAHNYDMFMLTGGYDIGVRAPHGSQLYWKDESPEYTPYPGVRASLTVTKTDTITYTVTTAQEEMYIFDNDGHLIQQKDAHGNVLDFSYQDDNLSRVEDPVSNRYLEFNYVTYGNRDVLRSVRDPLDRTVTFGYDNSGSALELVAITDTMEYVWTFAYTDVYTFGRMISQVLDPDGNIVEANEYSASSGKVIRQWNENEEWLIDYEDQKSQVGGIVTTTRRTLDGESVEIEIDHYGAGEGDPFDNTEKEVTLLQQDVDDEGNHFSYAYDDKLNRTVITNTRGFTTEYKYGDGEGCNCYPTVITDALSYTTTMTYDGHRLTSRTDALGRT